MDTKMPVHESMMLIQPSAKYEQAYQAYVQAFLDAGERPPFRYELALRDFPAYLSRIREDEMGIGIDPDSVPMSVYWLIDGSGSILGSSSFRHVLNDDLLDLGGNIGYKVHPFERRKGYGTLILKLTLQKAREKGLTGVLVTCDADNIASARIIQSNGGVFSSRSYSEKYQREISRYWIEL